MNRRGAFDWTWAGVPFVVQAPHHVEAIKKSGLYGLVRRYSDDNRIILYVDYAENIASTVYASEKWNEARRLGMNEFQFCLRDMIRIDGLILKSHIIRREKPLLNRLQQEEAPLQSEIGNGKASTTHGVG